ncbi:nucleotidyltransferase domain-containing protein [Xanthomonas oryzae]|uniref:nucleotidyltransferase domain-containing protein n=1 Tax=Xanthomonas oryzae TaxID=347 RepID=UPI001C666683|nr:nucleotidyltransferase domain-containing protein [Xanthomonas oryzae]
MLGVFDRQRQQRVVGAEAKGRIRLSSLDESEIVKAIRAIHPSTTSVALFGSVLRGQTDMLSDTDVLAFVPGIPCLQRGVYAVNGMLLDIHAVDAELLAVRMREEVRTRVAFYISLLDEISSLHIIGDSRPWQEASILAKELFRKPPPITTWEPLLTSLTKVVRRLGRVDDSAGYLTLIVALRQHLLMIMCLRSCGWIARESTMAEFVSEVSPSLIAQLDSAFRAAIEQEPGALLTLTSVYLGVVGGPKPPKYVRAGQDG